MSCPLFCFSEQANETLSFKQLSIENGLPHPRVQSVCVDRYGMVWIGTQSGLSRFDHYTLKNYPTRRASPVGLPSLNIRAVASDAADRIWVATKTGLALYDPKTDGFSDFYYQGNRIDAHCLYADERYVWIGATGELYRYDTESQTIERPLCDKRLGTTTKILSVGPGRLVLLSRGGGLFFYRTQTGELTPSTFATKGLTWSMALDKQGHLWVSDYGFGVYCLDLSSQKPLAHFTARNSGLSNDNVLDIMVAGDEVWFATDGNGISVYRPASRTFRTIDYDPLDSGSIQASSFYSLYQDRWGNIWAGSVREGLFLIRPSRIRTLRPTVPGAAVGLSGKVASALTYDTTSGLLWIGTDGGGINRYEPKSGTFAHYPATFGAKIPSITDFSPNELLVSAFNKGLFLFDKRTGAFERFAVGTPQEELNHFSVGNLVNLYTVGHDRTYIFGNYIVRYDHRTRRFTKLISKHIDRWQQSGLVPIDHRDSILYVMSYCSVLALDERTDRLSTLFSAGPDTVFQAAAVDHNANLWIGTDNGLLYVDRQTTQAQPIGIGGGLFSSVSTLTFDRNGRLWGGGDNMLFCYLTDKSRFVLFGESDGVLPSRFLFTRMAQTDPNYIYMGCTAGLVRIDRRIDLDSVEEQKLRLLDASVDGESVCGVYNAPTGTVVLPYDHTSFVVKVLTDQSDLFRKKLFRFWVEGLDSKPTESFSPIYSMGKLPVGRYRVWVGCLNHNGGWSDPSLLVEIEVLAPWWQRGWFVGLCILVGAGLIGGAVYFWVRSKKRKMEQALQQIEKQHYNDKINYLVNISHELRTPLTLILAPLKNLVDGDSLSEKDTRQVRNAYTHARYMNSVIDMVLDVQKMEAGRGVPLKRSTIGLCDWIAGVLEGFAIESQAKGVALNVTCRIGNAAVRFDPVKCKIVLSNLLMNAFKFSTPGGAIEIEVDHLGTAYVRVSVKDRGVGLGEVDPALLFTPFYQGQHNRQGTGIGLSYAKILIEQHGGAIGAEENEYGGATFYFDLPLDAAYPTFGGLDSPTSALDAPRQDEQNALIGESSVLVVDDQADFRDFMSESLADRFLRVDTASSAEEAMEKIGNKNYDLIVSDVVMPGGRDGFELCRQIKSSITVSHIPVVLLTSQCDEEHISMGYKMGADAYVGKPFDLERLLAVAAGILFNRRLIRQQSKERLTEPTEITFSMADEQFIKKLNQTITERIADESLSINFIARQMCMSRTSLYNKLNSITSLGVNQYVTRFRVDHAAHLLASTELSVTEISELSGFKHSRHFSTLFKSMKGVSPTQYRSSIGS